MTVSFASLPTSHRLWWGNANGASNLLGFEAEGVGAGGSSAAGVSAQLRGGAAGAAFDRQGNLWVSDAISDTTGIERYPASVFNTSGSKTPDVVVTSSAFSGGAPPVGALAFDAAG